MHQQFRGNFAIQQTGSDATTPKGDDFSAAADSVPAICAASRYALYKDERKSHLLNARNADKTKPPAGGLALNPEKSDRE
jgi:hypothetical protein